MARNPNKKRCKAKNRNGEQCKNWAKSGYEVCHYHGAKGGPPKKNKNAVKTGEYETIWLDTLEDDEKSLIDKINLDKLKQLDSEIRLTEIRERRMLQRIKVLKDKDFTIVSRKYGIEKDKETNLNEEEGTLGQIQAIEDALTRVQTHKAKLIELKHKLTDGNDEIENTDDGFMDALEGQVEEVWQDE